VPPRGVSVATCVILGLVTDVEQVRLEAPTCPNCGAPLELLGDGTCRWCHAPIERERPIPTTVLPLASTGGTDFAPWTTDNVDLGKYRSYSEPFATLFGWVDTLRQPPVPTGLGAGGTMYEFVRLISKIREHIGRIAGVAWDDHTIPRAARDELEPLLGALLDLVDAMAVNAVREQGLRATARAAVVATRQALGRKYQADPKRRGKAFAPFPELAAWVTAALSSSS
jgi:hypothetical protein